MHYLGFTEREALFEVPYARGLQYIHAALLSQGAHCVRPADADQVAESVLANHAALVKQMAAQA